VTDTASDVEAVALSRRRQEQILCRLLQSGAVRTSDLSRRWSVSLPTIRRDLTALEQRGLAIRVHGGAVRVEEQGALAPVPPAPALADAVQTIAVTAAGAVQPGSIVALSGGHVVEALAEQLIQHSTITVVTNSLRVAAILERSHSGRSRGPDVIVTGGQRGTGSLLVGPMAIASARSLRFDAAFVDCTGVDRSSGPSVGDIADAQVREQFLRSATRRYLLVEPSAFGVRSLTSFARLSDINTLVTLRRPNLSSPARSAVLSSVGCVLSGDAA
jgi:DeoR/GlpR family transcriptional regulator of sugar metabolism